MALITICHDGERAWAASLPGALEVEKGIILSNFFLIRLMFFFIVVVHLFVSFDSLLMCLFLFAGVWFPRSTQGSEAIDPFP